jgi:hypothetical protein
MFDCYCTTFLLLDNDNRTYTSNQKTNNALYLRCILNDSLNAAETNTLDGIAQQCPTIYQLQFTDVNGNAIGTSRLVLLD